MPKKRASEKKTIGTKKSRKIKEGDVKEGEKVENAVGKMEESEQTTKNEETEINNDNDSENNDKNTENNDNVTIMKETEEKSGEIDANPVNNQTFQSNDQTDFDSIPHYERDEEDSENDESYPAQSNDKISDQNGRYLGDPNQTLYINNLNDKIKKDDLKKSLYYLFSTYGKVLDVIALKTTKMRGQAHVVLSDIPAAALAMKNLQGFSIFGKNMRISFAKTKSDTVAKLDGTYRMPAPVIIQSTMIDNEQMDTTDDY